MAMKGVDEAVEQLERLYRTVTGKDVPSGAGPYAPIPPEKDPVRHVEEQLDRLVKVLAGPAPRFPIVPWTPLAALYEDEREIVIQVELPGVARDTLNVSVLQNVLTVSGTRTASLRGKDRREPRVAEFPVGPFSRSFLLPQGTAQAQVNAALEDGMLEVHIPRPNGRQAAGAQTSPIVVR
jgi:HSP20 family protein